VAAKLERSEQDLVRGDDDPIESITDKPVKTGFEFRTNYYRIQGPPPKKVFVAWQATGGSHHIPEKFGLLKLVD